MAKNKNFRINNGIEERLVPIRISEETMNEPAYEGKDIKWIWYGRRRHPYIMEWIPLEWADEIEKENERDVKAEYRQTRCRKPDGKGGTVRCSEKNSCYGCELCGHFDFDNMHDTSLDALMEEAGDVLPGSAMPTTETEEEEILTLMDDIIKEVKKENPLWGDILRQLYDGNEKPLNIAKALGKGKSTIYDNVEKAQEAGQKVYRRLMNEE